MYESMYSVQILTKYLYILSEKKKEMRNLSKTCPRVKVRSVVLTQRTAKDTAIVSKTNIQKYE